MLPATNDFSFCSSGGRIPVTAPVLIMTPGAGITGIF